MKARNKLKYQHQKQISNYRYPRINNSKRAHKRTHERIEFSSHSAYRLSITSGGDKHQ